MKTTVIVGDLNVDVVLPKMERMPIPGEELFYDRFALKAGGSAANTAITLARAGFPAKLFARVGNDGGASFLVKELRSSGVYVFCVRMDPAASTGITVSLPFPGTSERAYLTYPGSLSESGIGDIIADAPGAERPSSAPEAARPPAGSNRGTCPPSPPMRKGYSAWLNERFEKTGEGSTRCAKYARRPIPGRRPSRRWTS